MGISPHRVNLGLSWTRGCRLPHAWSFPLINRTNSRVSQPSSTESSSWPRAIIRRVRRRSAESTRQLVSILESVALRVRRTPRFDTQIELLCIVDLVQDLDLILPVALAARQDKRFSVTVCMTTWLHDVAPWVPERLCRHGFEPTLATRKQLQIGSAPDLSGVDVLLTASESTAASHRFAHALVRRANLAGIHTFTLQHGLENVGLTSRTDGEYDFASQRIFTWSSPDELPDWVPPRRRSRCIGVGRPQIPQDGDDVPSKYLRRPIVAVFENLHWSRYPASYSERFLADLQTAALHRPDLQIIVKPHPAGLWLTKNPDALRGRPDNLVIVPPADEEWRQVTARNLIRRSIAVVTTPSTIALDAASAGVPVALAAYGIDLGFYSPLPMLDETNDWLQFLGQASCDRRTFEAALQAFRHRHSIEGDACSRILDRLFEQATALHAAQ